MADINALLAQGVTPIQLESPVNQFAKLQALRGAQQEQQLNALKLQEAQTTMGQQEALRNYLAGASDYTAPEFTAGLTKFGAPGLAVAKGLSEQATADLTRQKTKTELTKAQSELVTQKTAQARQMLEGINPNDPNAPALYNQWLEAVHKDEVLGPTFDNYGATLESSKARLQAALAQPGGFANLLNESKLGAEKFAEHVQKQAEAASIAAYRAGELGLKTRELGLKEKTEERLAKAAEAKTNAPADSTPEVGKEFLKAINWKQEGGAESDDVTNLISKSTSGGAEALGAGAARFFGKTTEGMKAIAALKSRAADLTLKLLGGKLGSGVSNADREFMQQKTADIGNEKLTAEERIAAWHDLVGRMKAIAGVGGAAPAAAAPATVAPHIQSILDKYTD